MSWRALRGMLGVAIDGLGRVGVPIDGLGRVGVPIDGLGTANLPRELERARVASSADVGGEDDRAVALDAWC